MFKILKRVACKDEYREIDLLQRRVKRLQDENDSLWNMLDEIKASEVKNHNMSKEIDRIIEATVSKISKSVDIVKIVSNNIKDKTNAND